MTEKETPIEIVEMEMELSRFLKKGVTKITREGDWRGTENCSFDYRQNWQTWGDIASETVLTKQNPIAKPPLYIMHS